MKLSYNKKQIFLAIFYTIKNLLGEIFAHRPLRVHNRYHKPPNYDKGWIKKY